MDFLLSHPLLSDHTVRALCWTLVHSLWLGLLLALGAAAVLFLTKKSTAALRYNLLAALLAVFLAAVGYTFIDQWKQEEEGRGAPAITRFEASASGKITSPAAGAWLHPDLGRQFLESVTSFLNAQAFRIVAIWWVVFFLKCLKIAVELRLIRHLRRHGTHAPPPAWQQKAQELARRLHIRKAVTLLESDYVRVPSVVGFFRTVILVPVGLLAQLPPVQVEAILLHELAHIRRGDYLVNLIQHLAETVFFFNPAVLWVSALLRSEREHCCDDIAVAALRNKAGYLNALWSFEQFSRAPSPQTLAFAGKKGHLLHRVKRIIENHNTKTFTTMEKITLITGVLMAGFIALMPLPEARAQTKPEPKPEKTELRSINVTGTGTPAEPQQLTVQDAQGKTYSIKRSGQKVVEMYVDGQKVPDQEIADYTELIERVDEQIARDGELAHLDRMQAVLDAQQVQTDRMQAERDAAQAITDREQAKRDAEQAERDRAQALNDAGQARQDAEQARQDAAQAERDRTQAISDAAQAERDRTRARDDAAQAERDRTQAISDAAQAERAAQQARQDAAQAERDRQLMDNLVKDLVQDNLVKGKASLWSFRLSYTSMEVNGKTVPEELARKYREKYLDDRDRTIIFENRSRERL
jgi:bla regulator protein BlaR1